uniref:Fatty acid desaturase domain-containing protein n=1 Tax=Panagrolaimus sp. JU765 TaxID=591449 RepID=A0AC34Q5H0_9BILA
MAAAETPELAKEYARIASIQYLAQNFEESKKLDEEALETVFKPQYVWKNVFLLSALHVGALIGLFQLFTVAKWQSALFAFVLGPLISSMGVTAGAHRLWAHKSYKAKLPLRIILMCMNCVALQNDIIEWSRDHRCHHKWTDTDADPHNISRGFFFAHMGWLVQRKHPKVGVMGKKIDITDLLRDPVLQFQRKYYIPLIILFCFILPPLLAVYGWGETPFVAFYTAGLLRLVVSYHGTWLINSFAHVFGYRPYDINISPTENLILSFIAFGEAGHNYHHTFPQDYRTSEMSYFYNFTKAFIEFFALIGWAYDLKWVSDDVIQRQKAKQVEKLQSDKKHL